MIKYVQPRKCICGNEHLKKFVLYDSESFGCTLYLGGTYAELCACPECGLVYVGKETEVEEKVPPFELWER